MAAQVANIALNNMSLVFLSLSLSQIIRSGIPVVTALLGAVIEGKVPTAFELVSLVILTAGVVLSVRPYPVPDPRPCTACAACHVAPRLLALLGGLTQNW